MSNMSNLDIVLSEHKLSDAQKNAVVELLSPESGLITAKPNTLKSLERKGLVTSYAGGGWQLADEFRAELNVKTGTAESVESDAETGAKAETFEFPMAAWELELLGLSELIGWSGTEVWNGLTAAEIAEDIETATPVNRTARRTHFRTLRNAFRRLNNKQAPDSRKSLKITGKVGV